MKLVYKEPTFLGVVATILGIATAVIVVGLIISVHVWWFRTLVIIGTYYTYVRFYHKTYLYEEKIIIKYSILKFRNRIKEIDYKDCIIFEDANGPKHWDNFAITYREGEEKKLMGFHILDNKKVKEIAEFLESKNNRIKIKAKIQEL